VCARLQRRGKLLPAGSNSVGAFGSSGESAGSAETIAGCGREVDCPQAGDGFGDVPMFWEAVHRILPESILIQQMSITILKQTVR
jgi:hypothetical protein